MKLPSFQNHHFFWIAGGLTSLYVLARAKDWGIEKMGDAGKSTWTSQAGDPLEQLKPGNFKRFIAAKKYLDGLKSIVDGKIKNDPYQVIRDARSNQQSKENGSSNFLWESNTPETFPLSSTEQALVLTDNDIASIIASSDDDAFLKPFENDPLGIRYAKESYAKAAMPYVQGALKAAYAAGKVVQ